MMKALLDWRAFPCKSDLDIDDNDSDDDDSNSISESFPRQVFNGVVAIQAEMKSGLNGYTEKQGQPLSRSYRKMHMSREVWHFTVHALEKSCGVNVVHTLKSTSCNKSLLQLAKHKKERRRKKIHRITLTGDSQLDSIAKLTGEGTTFGSQQKWPKVDEGVRAVWRNDTFNTVYEVVLSYDGQVLNMILRLNVILCANPQGGPWSENHTLFHAFFTGGTTLNQADTAVGGGNNKRDLFVEGDTNFDSLDGSQSLVCMGRVSGSSNMVRVRRDGDNVVLEMEMANVLPLVKRKYGIE